MYVNRTNRELGVHGIQTFRKLPVGITHETSDAIRGFIGEIVGTASSAWTSSRSARITSPYFDDARSAGNGAARTYLDTTT
jgi:hypothetical protein